MLTVNNDQAKTNSKRARALPIDKYTSDTLRRRFTTYRSDALEVQKIKEESGLPIRNANPPEDITENIVKFLLRNKKGDNTCCRAKCVGKNGDLYSDIEGVQEVKALTSDGPCSFGPKKTFDVIYFLDMRNWLSDSFVLWRLNVTHESKEWKGLKMSKSETHEDQCAKGRRPHIGFEKIYEQLKDRFTLVYSGTFEDIFTTVQY